MVNNTISTTLNAPSIEAVFLIVCVLFTCILCLYLVFIFGRKLQNSAYLRKSLVEGAYQQELKPLLTELEKKAVSGPLLITDSPHEEFGSTARLWKPDRYAGVKTYSSKVIENECREWELRERERYEKEVSKLEKKAMEQAESKIPKSMDISLLGGGWAFLLEFSTVIVIIFALIILGILDTLEGSDISTILAAIAGYVLGKASGTIQTPKEPT